MHEEITRCPYIERVIQLQRKGALTSGYSYGYILSILTVGVLFPSIQSTLYTEYLSYYNPGEIQRLTSLLCLVTVSKL